MLVGEMLLNVFSSSVFGLTWVSLWCLNIDGVYSDLGFGVPNVMSCIGG